MTPDAPAADNSFLTIDQAVANLDASEIEREGEAPAVADAASTEGQNTEAEPAAEDASEPEAVIDGEDAETDEGAEEGDEPQLPPLSPPALWNAEDKAVFDGLPRHLQERLLAKETESNRALASKFEEAAAIRKAAEAEASRFSAVTQKLDKLIPDAEQALTSRWGVGEIDWNRVAVEQGVERAFQLKNDFDREQAAIQHLKDAKDEAQRVQLQEFKVRRFDELKAIVPALADDKQGPTRQLALAAYMAKECGLPVEAIVDGATARQLSMGYKAFLYDQANASAKAQSSAPSTPAQTKPATPARPSVKATAAPARAGSPQSARLQALSRKPSLTTDELVELMDLQET